MLKRGQFEFQAMAAFQTTHNFIQIRLVKSKNGKCHDWNMNLQTRKKDRISIILQQMLSANCSTNVPTRVKLPATIITL